MGPQKQLSLQVTSADRGSGTLEETSRGSRRKAAARRAGSAARLGEPGRRPTPRPSQPSALTPGKNEASPEKPGQVSRGQPCPFPMGLPTPQRTRDDRTELRWTASPGLQPLLPSIPSTAKFSQSWKPRDRAGGAVQHSPRAPAGIPRTSSLGSQLRRRRGREARSLAQPCCFLLHA